MVEESLTVFALGEYLGDGIRNDLDRVLEFKNKLAYPFLLTFSDQINYLANQLKSIHDAIVFLEDWKKEEFFSINKTTYRINWSACFYRKTPIDVTLPQARKLFKETRLQYDMLLNTIKETYRIHGKKDDGTFYDPNEFLTEIEL